MKRILAAIIVFALLALSVGSAVRAASPTITLSPDSGKVNTSVTINGTGWVAGSTVTLFVEGWVPNVSPTAVVASDGTFIFTHTVTGHHSASGSLQFSVVDDSGSAAYATFTYTK